MSYMHGANSIYRLSGKLYALETGAATFAEDDADLVEAAKRGQVAWDGSKWQVVK